MVPVVTDPSPEAVRDQVERILASPQFANSPKLGRFLQVVVQEALAGRSDQIKEYVIGVKVYNRPQDYDPRTDATVRVEASKLRKRLGEYYGGQGRSDAIVISVPKGHYAPVFAFPSTKLEERPPLCSTKRLLLSAACLAAIATGVIYRAGIHERSFTLTQHRLISSFAGSHHNASFSPDGTMITFVMKADSGPAEVWIKNLSHDNATRLTKGNVDAAQPRWSPKNDRILFGRRGDGIWSVSPLGGSARPSLRRVAMQAFPQTELGLFLREREIWTASVDGSKEVRLEKAPQRLYGTDANPAFSPDGRWIALFHAEAGPKGDLWVIPAGHGTARRLTVPVWVGSSPRL